MAEPTTTPDPTTTTTPDPTTTTTPDPTTTTDPDATTQEPTVVIQPPETTVTAPPAKPAEEPAKAPETKPAEKAPEKSDLKLAEDAILGDADIERIVAEAKEQGLSKEQAQSLLDHEEAAVSRYTDALHAQAEEWLAQAKADPEIGGPAFEAAAENSRRVVERFGNDALKVALNESGLGNHREVVRFLSKIGKAMADDKLIVGNAPGVEKKSVEDLLYSDAPNKPESQ